MWPVELWQLFIRLCDREAEVCNAWRLSGGRAGVNQLIFCSLIGWHGLRLRRGTAQLQYDFLGASRLRRMASDATRGN